MVPQIATYFLAQSNPAGLVVWLFLLIQQPHFSESFRMRWMRNIFCPILKLVGTKNSEFLQSITFFGHRIRLDREIQLSNDLETLMRRKKLRAGSITLNDRDYLVTSTSVKKAFLSPAIINNRYIKGFMVSRHFPSLTDCYMEMRDFSADERLEMIKCILIIIESLAETRTIHGHICLNSVLIEDDQPIRLKLSIPSTKIFFSPYFTSSNKIKTGINSFDDDLYSLVVVILYIILEKDFYVIFHRDVNDYQVKAGLETLNLLMEFLAVNPNERPHYSVLMTHTFQSIKLEYTRCENSAKFSRIQAALRSNYFQRPFKQGKIKKTTLTWFSQGVEPSCWSFPIIYSLTSDEQEFIKYHTELLTRLVPTYNYGFGNNDLKQIGQGFNTFEIRQALTIQRRVPSNFPRIRIETLFDRQAEMTTRPVLKSGDLITGMQFKKDESGDEFTSDWHVVSYYRTVDENTIECVDSAYPRLKRCHWSMPSKRTDPVSTFVIQEVERITRL